MVSDFTNKSMSKSDRSTDPSPNSSRYRFGTHRLHPRRESRAGSPFHGGEAKADPGAKAEKGPRRVRSTIRMVISELNASSFPYYRFVRSTHGHEPVAGFNRLGLRGRLKVTFTPFRSDLRIQDRTKRSYIIPLLIIRSLFESCFS